MDVKHVYSFFLQRTAPLSGKRWRLLLIGRDTRQSKHEEIQRDRQTRLTQLIGLVDERVCSFQSFAEAGQTGPTQASCSHLQLPSVVIKQRGADPDLLLLLPGGCQFKGRHQRRKSETRESICVFSCREEALQRRRSLFIRSFPVEEERPLAGGAAFAGEQEEVVEKTEAGG